MTIEERHARWRAIIDNQASSGMNIAAYCRESHIHTSLFYTWRRRLTEQQCAGGFIKLSPDRSIGRVSGICIRLGGSVRIDVERGFDPATLRAVIEALSRCSA